MPVTVNSKGIHGHNDAGSSLRAVQVATGQPVSLKADTPDVLERNIIAMQKYLVTQGKFSAGNVNTRIDNQLLGAKLAEVQVAANLP